MSRYIDASRIDPNQQTIYDYVAKKWCKPADIPTVDVERVVRCKDCVYGTPVPYGTTNRMVYICHFSHDQPLGADHFCSFGSPKS